MAYLSRLMYIIQKYKVPLENLIGSEEEILNKSEIDSIFGNIVDVKNCAQSLVKQLNKTVAPTTSGNSIGTVFTNMVVPLSKAYIPFILNYEKSAETYQNCKKNEKFVQFEKECEKDSRNTLLTLQDILIMPIQRITKFTLFFEQLKKLTPEDHVDYQDIVDASSSIGTLCNKINESKRRAEMLEDLRHIRITAEDADLKTSVNINWTTNEMLQRLHIKLNLKRDINYGILIKTKKKEKWIEPNQSISMYSDIMDEEVHLFVKERPISLQASPVKQKGTKKN